jgi:hypothetical protein
MSNTYRLVVELPKSDGVHTHDDLHLATTVKRRLEAVLAEPGSVAGCAVEYDRAPKDNPEETSALIQTLYKRLLSLHLNALLTHGPEVAQGIGLAVREAVAVLPELEAVHALQEWTENTTATSYKGR